LMVTYPWALLIIPANLLTKTSESVLHLYAKAKYINNELFANMAQVHPRNTPITPQKCSDINLCDSEGDTFLHGACSENHDQAVVTLIKFGANANLPNAKGNFESRQNSHFVGETALHVAARYGFMKIVQILVDLGGADPRVMGEKGTPLDVAMVGSPIPAFLELVKSSRYKKF
jgi:ankyrin repeat protein